MASSDKRRRKHDPLNPALDGNESTGTSEIFASSIRSTQAGVAINRRLRTSSHGSKATIRMDAGFDGWQVEEHPLDDDEPPGGYATSSSSTIRTRKSGHLRGLTGSLNSHPLASSNVTSQGFNQDHSLSSRSGQATPLSNKSESDSWTAVSNPEDYSENISAKGKGKQVDEARTVIVHTVTPLDSLAGVALKYGVELADLKRANKLWSSDSIHLRKVLYIPVDAQKWGSKHALAFDNLIDLDEPTEKDGHQSTQSASSSPSPARASSTSRHNSPERDQLDSKPAVSVRRIPASQLSFFPPPSTPQSARRRSNEVNGLSQSPLKFESSLRTSDGSIFGTMPRATFSPNLDPFGPTPLSSSATSRVLPNLFSVFSIPSSRVSLSSEADTETSDDLDVELDNADGWSKGRRSMASRTGARRPPLVQASSPVEAGLLPSQKPAAPRIIRNQQPAPSPLMELPVRSMQS